MSFERVAPPQVNYDNVLPLAVESRSNRREFLPVNGQVFSNTNGATIVRIDVNADSMLDPTHSYLECVLKNTGAADTFLGVNPFSPAWIQRLRIESGGVVIEDINEYSRLYAMLVLNQTPKEYVQNNMNNMGMYNPVVGGNLKATTVGSGGAIVGGAHHHGVLDTSGGTVTPDNICGNLDTELYYPPSAQAVINGVQVAVDDGAITGATSNQPSASGLSVIQAKSRISSGAGRRMCIPLVSGWLNMDRYIPLIMMNAGFTIELTLCDSNRIGFTQTETAGDQGAEADSSWEVSGCKYVAHLIDMERDFYDRLRLVMDDAGGTLQLAGQTYRHYTGNIPAGTGPHTITLPARVKSVKSIFGTFIDSTQMGSNTCYDTSVFQSAFINKYRFEIGSVRYPQTDVAASTVENEVELMKAFGKLGDYSHQQAYGQKHLLNVQTLRDGKTLQKSTLSAYTVGYDFEAFQRVALESGINTADRSLPINFICEKSAETQQPTRADFFVLTDAIFYINLDGTASVSV
jgi:hypothetical protein